MMDWNRKRHPEDVPTPVAVAVSDYCRRAKAQASPGLVREALSLIEESADAQVLEFANHEPTRKLGPFAVVDAISGTDEATCASRQAEGYYEAQRKAAKAKLVNEPPSPLPGPALVFSPPKPSASPDTKGAKKTGRVSVRDRIAPHKRTDQEREGRKPPTAPLPGSAFLPKRSLPAPRGRFTTVDPSRASFESLFRPEGKATVASLIEQVPHRVALLRVLEQGYVGRRGAALSVGDVEDVLEAHSLFEGIEHKEREGVLAAVIDEKGSLGRAAHSFGLTVEELQLLVGALGIDPEVDEIRARWVREAMAPGNLGLRIDLLFRTRYLEDLGIDRKFPQALKKQLREMVDEVRDAATTVPTLVDLISRQHALHADSLRKALEKLGLLEPWLKHAKDAKDAKDER